MTPPTHRLSAARRRDGLGFWEGASMRPTMKVAVVARRLGVAPATLRTWARRYGLGPSAHVAGSHRQYTEEDLDRLLVMRRLTLDGVAPAEAARIAVAYDSGPPMPDRSVLSLPAPTTTTVADAADLQGAVRALRQAVAVSDADRCIRLIEAALAEHGVVTCWQHVVLPVLAAEKSRWARAKVRVDATPMLQDCVVNAAHRTVRVVGGAPRVLLASAEGEQHELGLQVASAAFWERGTPVRSLGPRVPREALAAVARQVEPVVTVVLAVDPVRDPHQLHGLPGVHPGMQVVAFGPGWAPEQLPPTVVPALTLGDLVAGTAAG